MARNLLPSSMEHSDDEEYIDIEVSSATYFSSCSNSFSQNREFEFQMASITNYNTTSPADELFYRGRLLPLHQKILQTQLFEEEEEEEEDSFCIDFLITPIGSPSQSFELNPNDHKRSPKKLWSKLIKHSLINQKFKASREFLKSLFSKSSCTNGNCCSSKDMKVSKKKNPLKNTSNGTSCAMNNIESLSSRSFSAGEIKWQQKSRNGSSRSFSSTNSSSNDGSFSSSNSSFNSNNELNFLKRSSSFTSDIEAAVAHCKKSQDLTIPKIAIAHFSVLH